MIGASVLDLSQGRGSRSFNNYSIWRRSRLSVRCRRTCIQKILLQSPADNDEKASFLRPDASSVMPVLNTVRQKTLMRGRDTQKRPALKGENARAGHYMQAALRQRPGLNRRAFALHSIQWLPFAALLAGTDDPTTIVNSVLGRISEDMPVYSRPHV